MSRREAFKLSPSSTFRVTPRVPVTHTSRMAVLFSLQNVSGGNWIYLLLMKVNEGSCESLITGMLVFFVPPASFFLCVGFSTQYHMVEASAPQTTSTPSPPVPAEFQARNDSQNFPKWTSFIFGIQRNGYNADYPLYTLSSGTSTRVGIKGPVEETRG